MIKRIIAVSLLGASAFSMVAAHATTNGIYVDGQVGYVHTGNKFTGLPSDITISKSEKSAKKSSVAGRLAIGYQFTPHWAAELGYLQLGQQKSNLTRSFSVPTIVNVPGPFGTLIPQVVGTTKATTTEAITLNQHAFDIVGKGIYPISDKFNVYAKAGMAYLTTTVKSKGDMQYKGNPVTDLLSKHNWAPEAGIGLTYDVTPNVFIDTSFTHIQPIGKSHPRNIDFAAVGIGYSFG